MRIVFKFCKLAMAARFFELEDELSCLLEEKIRGKHKKALYVNDKTFIEVSSRKIS